MNVALASRIRHHEISDAKVSGRKVTAEERAANPLFGHVLGRLYLAGRITEGQFGAGIRYSEDMGRYYSTTGIPFPSARAQNLFAVRGESGDSESKTEAAKMARHRARLIRDTLLAAGDIDTGRRIEHLVKATCFLDEDREWSEPVTDLLRRGLNRLARYQYGIGS